MYPFGIGVFVGQVIDQNDLIGNQDCRRQKHNCRGKHRRRNLLLPHNRLFPFLAANLFPFCGQPQILVPFNQSLRVNLPPAEIPTAERIPAPRGARQFSKRRADHTLAACDRCSSPPRVKYDINN